MFMRSSIVITLGLFLMFVCGTSLSKCNSTSPCACIVTNKEVKNLIDSIYKRSLKDNVPYTFYVDLCTNVIRELSESKTGGKNYKYGSLCAFTSAAKMPIRFGIVKWSSFSSDQGFRNIAVSLLSENLTLETHINCSRKSNGKFAPGSDYVTMYKVPQLQVTDTYQKHLSTNGLSTGSTLVILLFVFSGLYFIGGAILLKLLRGATGWEILPNHKFWRDLPTLIRDGITFTFNCCRVDSYERI